MEKITLKHQHIGIAFNPRVLEGPIAILFSEGGNFVLYFEKVFFKNVALGWNNEYNEKYYGWVLNDKHDIRTLMSNMRLIVSNPKFLLTKLCDYCTNQVECILDNECCPRHSEC